jgi:potassium efflux system protein
VTQSKPTVVNNETTKDETMSDVASDFESGTPPTTGLVADIKRFSRYRPMLASVAFSFCSALFVPLLLLFLAWQLSPAFDLNTLRGTLHQSLIDITPIVLTTMMLMSLLSSKGPAVKHFGWSQDFCHGIYTVLWFTVCISLPCRFFSMALITFESGAWSDSLGRLFFLGSIGALVAGICFGSRYVNRACDAALVEKGFKVGRAERRRSNERLLNGDSIDSSALSAAEPWTAFARRFVIFCLPFVTLSLAGMSIVGYHFTAFEMSSRAIWSIQAMLAIAILAGFVSRLLLTTQFRVKLRQLTRNEEGHISEDESININEISNQVNRLVNVTALMAMIVAGWQIWSTVSPTISYLDSIECWKSAQLDTLGNPRVITPREILIALGVLAMSMVLSRNLPGLLEITLLDRLPLDKGGRYAISFVVRYMVGVIGLLCAFQIIGFSWSSVQWLAAGLTVGLGFGLQEIFANLISGLIILIERPVRVGDMVTVNGTTGTVCRMQLRATTIRDLDHCELIVPNKKFITEDVMNWTLSDPDYRAILKVGVAYGSDTKLVHQTLVEVARRHPLVKRLPVPEVLFKSFGDSTLDFELRVVIPGRQYLARVLHELNMAIDEAFREKNIEIAFPQREITIRNAEQAVQVPSDVKAA